MNMIAGGKSPRHPRPIIIIVAGMYQHKFVVPPSAVIVELTGY